MYSPSSCIISTLGYMLIALRVMLLNFASQFGTVVATLLKILASSVNFSFFACLIFTGAMMILAKSCSLSKLMSKKVKMKNFVWEKLAQLIWLSLLLRKSVKRWMLFTVDMRRTSQDAKLKFWNFTWWKHWKVWKTLLTVTVLKENKQMVVASIWMMQVS